MFLIFNVDIKVKEPTLESMTRKKKEYMPPRFMTVAEAASQILQVIDRRGVSDGKKFKIFIQIFLTLSLSKLYLLH